VPQGAGDKAEKKKEKIKIKIKEEEKKKGVKKNRETKKK